MRGLAVAAVLYAAAAASPGAAQEPPPSAPAARAAAPAPTPAPAPAPAPRPAAKPRSDTDGTAGNGSTAGEPGAAPPAARPRPASQGRLIPPDEMPPVPGVDAVTRKDAPSTAPTTPATTGPAETSPPAASSGRLIPPGQTPGAADGTADGTANGTADGDPATAQSAPVPLGPPVPETLRESDFAHAACRLELRRLGTAYREIPAITDPGQRDCGIARPIEVTEILPGVTLMGGAAMRCDTARSLAHWMRDIVLPAASYLPGSPRLTSLSLGTTYQCRGVVGNGVSQNLSEHAVGNAIDIAGFGFDNGARIDIAPTEQRGDLTVAFQNAVQGAACLFFATVLGPGSNAAHDDHLHLDIKARRGGFRLCQ